MTVLKPQSSADSLKFENKVVSNESPPKLTPSVNPSENSLNSNESKDETHSENLLNKNSNSNSNESSEKKIPLKLTLNEFKTFLETFEKKIPTRKSLKKLDSNRVHHLPEVLEEAAVEFGKIAEILEKKPDFIETALPFYFECAKNPAGIQSVRALCFYQFKKMKEKLNQTVTPNEMNDISSDVIELSEKLN